MQKIFHELFSTVQVKPFAVKYPNGDLVQYGPQDPGTKPTCTLVFNTERAMKAVATGIDLGFGESYMYGELDVEGNFKDFMEVAMAPGGMEEAVLRTAYRPGFILKHLPSFFESVLLYFFQSNTKNNSKKHLSMAYDTGNDFFQLMLDKNMLYTCAYFKTPDDTIDQAQEQKCEHVSRKLLLKPGETLLDIGCGWGGMLIHAAKHYGISGLGVTLSKAQADLAMERITQAGLQDRIQVKHMDYRDLPLTQRYDKIVSLGCLEHIGKSHYKDYFRIVKQLLSPQGLFLLHHIGNKGYSRPSLFARKYLFPGSYAPPLYEVAEAISREGMRIHDVENLRIHYAYTAERWLENVERHKEEITKMYDDVFVRVYRLYLNHGMGFCRYGAAELFQVLLSPHVNNELLPLTREHLYQNSTPSNGNGTKKKPTLATSSKK